MRISYASAKQMPAGAWKWPHIDAAMEWADSETGQLTIETEFMDRFELLRAACDFPLPISSGFRTPEHNAKVSPTGKRGPHTTSRAVDVVVTVEQGFIVISKAPALGFTGIGVKKSEQAGHVMIHLDDLKKTNDRPRPALCGY